MKIYIITNGETVWAYDSIAAACADQSNGIQLSFDSWQRQAEKSGYPITANERRIYETVLLNLSQVKEKKKPPVQRWENEGGNIPGKQTPG